MYDEPRASSPTGGGQQREHRQRDERRAEEPSGPFHLQSRERLRARDIALAVAAAPGKHVAIIATNCPLGQAWRLGRRTRLAAKRKPGGDPPCSAPRPHRSLSGRLDDTSAFEQIHRCRAGAHSETIAPTQQEPRPESGRDGCSGRNAAAMLVVCEAAGRSVSSSGTPRQPALLPFPGVQLGGRVAGLGSRGWRVSSQKPIGHRTRPIGRNARPPALPMRARARA